MAWTAPSTRSTGDLITASIWNVDLKDNLDYLKTETDKLDDVTFSAPARSLGSIYQNTGGTIIFVAVTVFCVITQNQSSANSYFTGDVGSGSPPSNVLEAGYTTVTTPTGVYLGARFSMGFFIPTSFYYRVTGLDANGGTAPTLIKWTEWDLH